MREEKPMRAVLVAVLLLGAEMGIRWSGAAAVYRVPVETPPAGEYACLKSRLSYSPVQGPAGPLLTIQYDPSIIGSITLDGRGGYRAFKKAGRYTFDSMHSAFVFVSGPL